MKIDGNFCLEANYRVNINGAQFAVKGYPYISQSTEATVCAHSALWGACRYLSERYSIYRELYPYDLVELTGQSLGRKVPYRGMTYTDYSEILSAFGCYPVILCADTGGEDWKKDPDFFYNLYSYVESGFPVLTSFNGHVVTIVGHTIKDAIEKDVIEESGFVNSFNLLKDFIVVDDNFFPYQKLSYKTNANNYGQLYNTCLTPVPSIDSIFASVVPLPEKAFLPPEKARKLFFRFFSQDELKNDLTEVLKELGVNADENIIYRLFLTSVNSFKKRKSQSFLGSNGEADALSQFPLNLQLPHFIWVVELSPFSLYKSGYCVAELVLDASTNYHEADYIYMRIGNRLHYNSLCANHPDGFRNFVQYTHNLGER